MVGPLFLMSSSAPRPVDGRRSDRQGHGNRPLSPEITPACPVPAPRPIAGRGVPRP